VRAQGQAAPVQQQSRLLARRQFLLFVVARTVSSAGTAVTTVVLPVLVYRLTRSPGRSALVGAVEAIPYLLLGIFAGVLADRASRKKMMLACDLCSAILIASIPLSSVLGFLNLTQILVSALGVAAMFVLFDAANFAMLPAIVSHHQLPAAGSALWVGGLSHGAASP
jgi:MFS family permease